MASAARFARADRHSKTAGEQKDTGQRELPARRKMTTMNGWRWLRRLAWIPLVSKSRETKELTLRCRGRRPLGFESFPRRYYPDRVRGYFSAPHPWSTPVSITRLKHSGHGEWQMGALDEAAIVARGVWPAISATEVPERTASMARCASTQTGCAGHSRFP